MERRYLTIDEKMDFLIERLFQAFGDQFDDEHTEEEIDKMLEEDKYFDAIREQFVDLEGFEDITFKQLCEMSNESILEVYNITYGEKLTLQEVIDTKVYWTKGFRTAVEN